MGLRALTGLVPRLRAALPAGSEVEVTAISQASLPTQQQVTAPLDAIVTRLEAVALEPPVVFILVLAATPGEDQNSIPRCAFTPAAV
jgi:uroporphyrin-III C-methyltransferase